MWIRALPLPGAVASTDEISRTVRVNVFVEKEEREKLMRRISVLSDAEPAANQSAARTDSDKGSLSPDPSSR